MYLSILLFVDYVVLSPHRVKPTTAPQIDGDEKLCTMNIRYQCRSGI
jgi:hypothetical protein